MIKREGQKIHKGLIRLINGKVGKISASLGIQNILIKQEIFT